MNERRKNFSSGSRFEALYGYSRAVRVGDQLWIAGTTGFDYQSMTLPADPAEQTRQVIRNIDAALARAGSSRADIVQLTTWIRDPAQWDAIGAVLGEAFADVLPTNAALVVDFPFPDIAVEIAAIAAIGRGRKGDDR